MNSEVVNVDVVQKKSVKIVERVNGGCGQG